MQNSPESYPNYVSNGGPMNHVFDYPESSKDSVSGSVTIPSQYHDYAWLGQLKDSIINFNIELTRWSNPLDQEGSNLLYQLAQEWINKHRETLTSYRAAYIDIVPFIKDKLIEQFAYYLWESEGRQEGKSEEYWNQSVKRFERLINTGYTSLLYELCSNHLYMLSYKVAYNTATVSASKILYSDIPFNDNTQYPLN